MKRGKTRVTKSQLVLVLNLIEVADDQFWYLNRDTLVSFYFNLLGFSSYKSLCCETCSLKGLMEMTVRDIVWRHDQH